MGICYAMVSESIAKTAALIQSYCAFESCEKKYDKAEFNERVASAIDKTTIGRRAPTKQEDKSDSLAAGLLAAGQISYEAYQTSSFGKRSNTGIAEEYVIRNKQNIMF